MSQGQLNELLRLITRRVLKEYSVGPTSSSDDDSTSPDGEVQTSDAMTASEKRKQQQQAKKKQQDLIRTAKLDLDSTKTQQDYFLTQAEKNKKDIDAKQRKLQQMKGAHATDIVPAGGTVVEDDDRKYMRQHPQDQLNLAKQQLENFLSMLELYHEEGLDTLARDMLIMAKEIRDGKPISTY